MGYSLIYSKWYLNHDKSIRSWLRNDHHLHSPPIKRRYHLNRQDVDVKNQEPMTYFKRVRHHLPTWDAVWLLTYYLCGRYLNNFCRYERFLFWKEWGDGKVLKSEIILVLHYACSQFGEQLCERKMLKVSIIRMFTYANEASVVISLKKKWAVLGHENVHYKSF